MSELRRDGRRRSTDGRRGLRSRDAASLAAAVSRLLDDPGERCAARAAAARAIADRGSRRARRSARADRAMARRARPDTQRQDSCRSERRQPDSVLQRADARS